MRIWHPLPRREQLAGAIERVEPHADPRKRVGSPFLPVDDAHGMADDEAGLANGLHRLAEGAARGDDVLDETHELTWLVRAFEAVPGSVSLGFTADNDEGQAGRHRPG